MRASGPPVADRPVELTVTVHADTPQAAVQLIEQVTALVADTVAGGARGCSGSLTGPNMDGSYDLAAK